MEPSNKKSFRNRLHEIIYEADTPMGKFFDVMLLLLIILSIIFVMLESIAEFDLKYHRLLYIGEWVITIFFTIEYIARILTVKKPMAYIFSFYGIIDLLSTIPLYLSFIFPGSSFLFSIRAVRLLRVFRIMKITRYVGEATKLRKALINSRIKIFVFLFAVVIIAIITGTLMYIIEGPERGFTNIPVSVYWCIVTLTTVGFGDITPDTPLGQLLASIIMILGYGIIAVPTGIVSAEYSKSVEKLDVLGKDYVHVNTQACPNCGAQRHRDDSEYCHKCGHKLNPESHLET